MDGSRRLFLKTAGLMLAFAGGHYLLNGSKAAYPVNSITKNREAVRLIRPPGAVEEKSFLSGCIRCLKCQDACIYGAIQMFDQDAGKAYLTPYVDPAIKACTLCMKCTQVCPTQVLKPMKKDEIEKVDMATVALYPDRCLAYKAKYIRNEQRMLVDLGKSYKETGVIYERRGPCGECYMTCPVREKAIKVEPGALLAPLVYKEHCVGCGLCEEICRVVLRGVPAITMVPTRKSV